MIKPELIRWARNRAKLTLREANKKTSSTEYKDWEEGKSQPTIDQIKKISQKFFIPLGYLYLSEPPEEKLPIPDFRTTRNKEATNPSPELLDTIHDAQRKQNWLREQKIEDGEDKVVAKESLTELQVIEKINEILEIQKLREEKRNYKELLSAFIKRLDENDFLLVRNGVVGSNNGRSLDKEEFKGFALFDEYAPLVFINGNDYKSIQIFTLVQGLVHIFLNESGLDEMYYSQTKQKHNKITTEILLPEEAFKETFKGLDDTKDVAKKFKVSNFLVLIKARQCNLISEEEFQERWSHYENALKEKRSNRGGDFYANAKFKAGGESFLRRVFHSASSGETLYRDAFSLTGLSGKAFNQYFEKQGLRT